MKENIPIGQAEEAMANAEELQRREYLYNHSPFLKLLDMQYKNEEDGVRLELEIQHKHANIYGIAHGGVLFSLADTAMGWACYEAGLQVVTLDSSVNYLKPAPQGAKLHVKGKLIHAGRRTAVCECWIYDENDTLCLKGHGTFCVLSSEGAKA